MLKVAVVGKGGSGKSTLSWLLIQALAHRDQSVLGIDADFNMNLLTNLGLNYGPDLPTIHHAHGEFRQIVDLPVGTPWSKLQDRSLPQFSLNPDDDYTAQLAIDVAKNIRLMVVGLGDEDVLDSPLCGHGHIAPLKWYLSNLDNHNTAVIIDSVAGTDMVNYNLYQGCDAIVCVVENHRNSIRVFQQIQQVADRLGTPFYGVWNRANEAAIPTALSEVCGDRLLGQIPVDPEIESFDYQLLDPQTQRQTALIWEALVARTTTSRSRSLAQAVG
ncbi:MAG: AAA family ATPase [Alkalinema sp. RU_4_3]|nr:AAA family ATPase [Alkalinema sp. RU_4_3]